MKKEIKKVLLATGGTGGHIFPAISIAEKLTTENIQVLIVADEVYNKYSYFNYNYTILKTAKNIKSIKNIKNIILNFFKVFFLIKKEKPDLIVSFGSYATFSTLIAGFLSKIPILLHEQNIYVGKVNRLFSKLSKKIMISYHELYGLSYKSMNKVIYTGLPIRKEFKKLYQNKYQYPKENEKFNILIIGGSAGAKIFSEYLPRIFDKYHIEEQKKLKIYHQVRPEYIYEVQKYYSSINLDAEVSPFFINIHELLSKTHLIISRAGSSSISEIAVAGIPAILVPLETIGSNRQIDNAKYFIKNKASILIEEKNFTIKYFQSIFFKLIKDKNLLEEMSSNLKKLANIDADLNIYNIIINNNFNNCE